MYTPTVKWIISWIAHHFRVFTGIAITTSTPIEVMGSHEVAGKDYINSENSQIASIGAIFGFTYHIKQLTPWPNSLASCVVNYSRLSTCPWKIKLFKDDRAPLDLWQVLETSHSKSSLGNFQHRYLSELLVNMYNCHVMVKSVPCYCVCGCVWRPAFINSSHK